jgi:hypothetical protein
VKSAIEGIGSAQVMSNFEQRPITINDRPIDAVDDEIIIPVFALLSFAGARI